MNRPLLVHGEALVTEVDRGGGGGEKFHPVSPAEAQSNLGPQIHTLARNVEAIDWAYRTAHVVFEARILANYLAASYFPTEMVEKAGLQILGSRHAIGKLVKRDSVVESSTKALLIAATDESIARLEQMIDRTIPEGRDRLWESFVRIDEIRLTPSERVVRSTPKVWGEGELFTWEAVFHPAPRVDGSQSKESENALEKWAALVKRVHGEVDLADARSVGNLTFLPVAATMEGLDTLARFNPLRCIRVMPRVRPLVVPVHSRNSDTFTLHPPGKSETPLSPTRIAVFDGGVDDTCPFVAPFVRQINLTTEPINTNDVAHGAAVTNAVLYGYVPGDGVVPRPDVGVDHYRVLPLPKQPRRGEADDVDRDLYWLLDQIEETVRKGNYPLVNLSLGPDLSVDDDGEPDRWTSSLDTLANEKSVLFVTAAGNSGANPPEEMLHRVQVPADMVNGLGVGACTSRDGAIERCVYSSQGPGRWGARIQPAGVSFGGLLPHAPFVCMLSHGAIFPDEGTSYAAPLTSHGLTGLIARLDPTTLRPELLRAFAIHFAERRSIHHQLAQIGHGRFREGYSDLWVGDPATVNVVYQGDLSRDDVAGFSLPFPDGIPKGTVVEMWWTVCVTTQVDPSDPVEYTKAGVEVTFRPHREIYSFYNPKTKTVGRANIVSEKTKALAFIREGAEQSKMPVAKPLTRVWSNEQGKRAAGKWETTVQHRFRRLRSMTLLGPAVELKYLAREGGSLQKDPDPLRFSMIVTIRATNRATPIDLYDRVRAEFPLLVPVEIKIPVRV